MNIRLLSIWVLMTPLSILGQQIEGLLKQKPFAISGGLNISQNMYWANQIENRFLPYTLMIGGNVNVSIYGVQLPFTFQYTNQQVNFSTPQPFNIIGVSPSYKNLTLHAGYRNMTFSKYTLNGHGYLGGGVEYKFSKLKVMAMGGRLLKATPAPRFDEALAQTRNLPSYSRIGSGIKLEYQDKGTTLGFIGFYAKDRESSLELQTDTLNARPEENQVYAFNLNQQLNKVIDFSFEGALSAWTRNMQDTSRDKEKFYEYAYFLPVKSSTVFYGAINAGLNFKLDKSTIGINYERVDPEYKTLGTYFINNDFQNVTLNLTKPFFDNKVNFSANGGFQKDDLEGNKQTNMRRIVGSTNLSIKWSEKVNTNLAYSNFNNVINVRPVEQALLQNSPYDRIDTLRLVQISQSASFSTNYQIVNDDNQSKSIALNSNFASSASRNENGRDVSNMLNAGLNYNHSLKESKFNWGVGLNVNQNYLERGTLSFYGVNTNFSKPILKEKLRVSIGFQGNANFEGNDRIGLLYGINNTYNITLAKKHSLGLFLQFSGRVAEVESELTVYDQDFYEFNGSFTYGYTFAYEPKKNKNP